MYFCNYIIEKQPQSIKITADFVADFQHSDNETLMIGTPKWWDDYVANNIDFSNFDLYFLCSRTVYHGQYNSVTDFKKVWGLNKLEKGFYENQYFNNKGKVYFGIIKGDGENSFRSIKSSMVLFIPKGLSINADEIYKIISSEEFDFLEMEEASYKALKEISQLCKGSILLKYTCINEVSLLVFGNTLANWFNKEKLICFNRVREVVPRIL